MKYQKSYAQKLGPEHHMQSWVDGFWGDTDSRLKQAELSQPLSEFEDLQKIYEQAYHSLPQPRPSEHFVCFMPNIERDVFAASRLLVLLASLPAPINSCYSYSFTRTDVARRSHRLLGKDRHTVVGVRWWFIACRIVVASQSTRPPRSSSIRSSSWTRPTLTILHRRTSKLLFSFVFKIVLSINIAGTDIQLANADTSKFKKN